MNHAAARKAMFVCWQQANNTALLHGVALAKELQGLARVVNQGVAQILGQQKLQLTKQHTLEFVRNNNKCELVSWEGQQRTLR